MTAVKKDGFALRYVKEQTPEICAEAILNDEDAWEFVKDELADEVKSLLEKKKQRTSLDDELQSIEEEKEFNNREEKNIEYSKEEQEHDDI